MRTVWDPIFITIKQKKYGSGRSQAVSARPSDKSCRLLEVKKRRIRDGNWTVREQSTLNKLNIWAEFLFCYFWKWRAALRRNFDKAGSGVGGGFGRKFEVNIWRAEWGSCRLRWTLFVNWTLDVRQEHRLTSSQQYDLKYEIQFKTIQNLIQTSQQKQCVLVINLMFNCI
jgi:hypothetical protein